MTTWTWAAPSLSAPQPTRLCATLTSRLLPPMMHAQALVPAVSTSTAVQHCSCGLLAPSRLPYRMASSPSPPMQHNNVCTRTLHACRVARTHCRGLLATVARVQRRRAAHCRCVCCFSTLLCVVLRGYMASSKLRGVVPTVAHVALCAAAAHLTNVSPPVDCSPHRPSIWLRSAWMAQLLGRAVATRCQTCECRMARCRTRR